MIKSRWMPLLLAWMHKREYAESTNKGPTYLALFDDPLDSI